MRKENKLGIADTRTGGRNSPSRGKKLRGKNLGGWNSGDNNAAKETLNIILNLLEEAKADNTVSIGISEKSSIGDYMVVTSGRSSRHVEAICDQLLRHVKNAGWGSVQVEGQGTGDWILIDCGDIIIHIFRPEIREFYNIEKMWMAPEDFDKIIY